MTAEALLLLALLACSLVPAAVVAGLDETSTARRNRWTLGGAVLKVLLVTWMMLGVQAGRFFEATLPLTGTLTLELRVDALALLFVSLSAVLWLATSVFAIAYLAKDPAQRRFFTFFNFCVTATTGIALAGNLFTFFVFYELLTLATWPLVAHRGDRASLQAARLYLRYTLAGSVALLIGMLWLQAIAGPIAFGETGKVARLVETQPAAAVVCFALMAAGLAVKGAMVPFHAWLPAAMVAPAPVSALLHAVAVVKAGAFGIVRLVLDVYGIEASRDLGLGLPLALWASLTIIVGSVIALRQDTVKKRLAYSTVSQVSYIMLGVSLLGPIGLVGGLVHLIHQGLMKITLFFCAGALEKLAGVTRIDQMAGVGWRVPWTMLAFSVAAIGMMGAPPLAGFVSKWYLGLGGIEVGALWIIAVLAGSTLLNALYFLPLIYAAWFQSPPGEGAPIDGKREALANDLRQAPTLVAPAVVIATAALAAGLFAASDVSPLAWSELIVDRQYRVPWPLPE
ncbi:MAG: monovalent cation/H+ antiporter subunit D family protein [Geminicoccaceae bacterium]|nr:MAG: monovalent cation/H+ antiporter subunit D family protein [Geminicoccaceae bacterium]